MWKKFIKNWLKKKFRKHKNAAGQPFHDLHNS